MAKLSPQQAELVVEILDDAVALMNDKGTHWIKGSYEGENAYGEEAYCSVGAIWRAVKSDAKKEVLTGHAIRAVAEAYRPYESGRLGLETVVTIWNDRSDTTWGKVVKRFERAKKRALAMAAE